MDKEQLLKYIQGALNAEQAGEVLWWIGQCEENAAVFAALKADWVFGRLPNTVLPEEQAKRLLHRQSKPFGKELLQTLMRVAAVLFIPLTGLAFYFMLTRNAADDRAIATFTPPQQQATHLSYHTNPGVKGLVVLPDSSMVWLNSCSTIKCPGEFNNVSRNVELSGEAYFDVKSNTDWPMYVKTPKGITVVVSGTSFNISAYEDDRDFKFTMISGVATLIREKMRQSIAMAPNDYIVIPDNNRPAKVTKSSNTYYNTAWKEGFLLFENTPMDEVIKKVERWYGVNITVNDRSILDYRFTASFHSESVSRVLDLLKITSNINSRIKDKEVTLFLTRK